jgi:Tol biopolymer transport system component
MPLPSGARIGPYEIVGLLGAGGMGEVYRATDLHLGRAAAIKVLPETFALDAERIARLEREARTLASLNHPNIAQVFGFEKGDAGVALAMELVEGPTLADRIDRGPIPIDEAITIARQVAEALEAAHDQGIVHRDLKPANVTVRNDGTVKVLDFGLAKAIEAGTGSRESGVGNTLAEPTVTTPAMTATGLIMGTAAYMSPEQARGRAVDRRADIWAFGCVLYEMLTGRRAFPGDDISDVLVAVLRDEPDLSALPSDTPRHIRKLLRRCLQKDPRNRLPHIGAARLELSDPLDSAEAPITPRGSRSRVGERALWAAVVAGLAGLLALAVQPSRDGTMPARAVVFDIPPPSGARFPGGNGVPRFAVSPDGSRLAYQARVGNSTAWFVRRLDAVTSQQVPGTEAGSDVAAQGLFWSPDNQSLAFFDEPGRKLKKVDLGTSTVSVLCDVTGNQHGGSWNADGVIIFSSAASGGVWKVPAPGGKAIPLTTLDEARGETAHLFPQFLPGNRRFVYLAVGRDPAVFAGSLAGAAPVRLFDSINAAVVAPPDALLVLRGDSLVMQQFDFSTLKPIGESRPVANNVLRTAAGRVAASASAGVVAYARAGTDTSMVGSAHWVDRSGRPLDRPPIPGGLGWVRLSPDGRYVGYSVGGQGGVSEIWLYDLVRQIPTRLSATSAGPLGAAFSPDGTRIAYRQDDADGAALVEQPLSGAGPARVLMKVALTETFVPTDWAPDGGTILLSSNRSGHRGLYLISLAGDGALAAFIDDRTNRVHAAVSPDGRWVAYTSDESGQSQVFVQSFPDPRGGKWTVSKPGGGYPRWRRDGRELFFAEAGSRIYSVSATNGDSLRLGQPTLLFEVPMMTMTGSIGAPYDVSPDGQRFLVVEPRADMAITVVVNRDRQITR